jgi:hypothetical protein
VTQFIDWGVKFSPSIKKIPHIPPHETHPIVSKAFGGFNTAVIYIENFQG